MVYKSQYTQKTKTQKPKPKPYKDYISPYVGACYARVFDPELSVENTEGGGVSKSSGPMDYMLVATTVAEEEEK